MKKLGNILERNDLQHPGPKFPYLDSNFSSSSYHPRNFRQAYLLPNLQIPRSKNAN